MKKLIIAGIAVSIFAINTFASFTGKVTSVKIRDDATVTVTLTDRSGVKRTRRLTGSAVQSMTALILTARSLNSDVIGFSRVVDGVPYWYQFILK